MINNYQNLATINRAGSVESVHFGFWGFFNGESFQGFGLNEKVCLRSVSKPFQALACLELGLEVNHKELAICSSSHSASQEHLEVLWALIHKFNISPELLQCGAHEPFQQSIPLIEPRVLQNNCSGKHLMMLQTCKINGWELANYLKPEHPLQQAILGKLTKLCECTESEIEVGLDGCGLPTYGLKAKNILIGFNKLKQNSPDKNLKKLAESYLEHSFYVSGNNRLDHELTKACGGKILCKSGFGGITLISLQSGGSLLIKMGDANERVRAILLTSLLQHFGIALESTNILFSKEFVNLHGDSSAQLQIFLNI